MTLPEKEFILFGMKLASFINLLIFFVIAKIVLTITARLHKSRNINSAEDESKGVGSESPKTEPLLEELKDSVHTTSATASTITTRISFTSRVKLAFIKFLKLYFTPVTVACFKFTHCININDESRLYVYADQICYTSWQIVIFVMLLPGLLLFPICFELALRLLKAKRISTTQFVFVCGCPYLALLMYTMREKLKIRHSFSREEDRLIQIILLNEEELFKVDSDCMGWQIVQLYRTIVLTLLKVFIINPVYRQLAFFLVLVLFNIHDRSRQPYKNRTLNMVQSWSGTCLLLVLACNTLSAFSYMVRITEIPDMDLAKSIASNAEVVVYLMVPLSVPAQTIYTVLTDKLNRRREKKDM